MFTRPQPGQASACFGPAGVELAFVPAVGRDPPGGGGFVGSGGSAGFDADAGIESITEREVGAAGFAAGAEATGRGDGSVSS